MPEYIRTEVSKHFKFSTPSDTTNKQFIDNDFAHFQIEGNEELKSSRHFADKFKKLLLIT